RGLGGQLRADRGIPELAERMGAGLGYGVLRGPLGSGDRIRVQVRARDKGPLGRGSCPDLRGAGRSQQDACLAEVITLEGCRANPVSSAPARLLMRWKCDAGLKACRQPAGGLAFQEVAQRQVSETRHSPSSSRRLSRTRAPEVPGRRSARSPLPPDRAV